MSMNKSELVSAIAAEAKITKVQAEKSLEATLNAITKEMSEGGSLTLVGFGTFKVQTREARVGRNPKTGETLNIPEKKTVKFTPGKLLKETIN